MSKKEGGSLSSEGSEMGENPVFFTEGVVRPDLSENL